MDFQRDQYAAEQVESEDVDRAQSPAAEAIGAIEPVKSTASATAESQGFEHFYRQGQTFFSDYAARLLELGWLPLPQEREGARKTTIKWGEFVEERRPTTVEVRHWSLQWPTHNVAVLCRDDLWALDLDTSDPELSWALHDAADEILGETPFKRMGRDPRMLMLYRIEAGERLPRKSWTFAEEGSDGARPDEENGFEILTRGLFTAYGHHHKLGRYFQWFGSKQPFFHGPSNAPLVTVAQVDAFIKRAGEIRALFRPRPNLPSSQGASANPHQAISYVQMASELFLPVIGESDNSPPEWTWREDKCVASREQYLYYWCRSFVRANGPLVLAGRLDFMVDRAVAHLECAVDLSGSHTLGWLRAEAREKIHRFAAQFRAKPHWFKAPVGGATGAIYQEAVKQHIPVERPADGSLSWLGSGAPETVASGFRPTVKTHKPEWVPGAEASRALIADRGEITRRMSAGIDAGLDAFIADVAAGHSHVHVIPAPTGSGKTTRAAQRLVAYAREMPEDAGPILFFAPTHQNLAELQAALEKAGATFEMGGEGVQATLYKGKIPAGCLRSEEVMACQASMIGTSGLCSSRRVELHTGEKVDLICKFWSECGYQRMRAQARASRVIILPHAYLSTPSMPTELARPSAVVIDESVASQILKATFLPFESLTIPRAETALHKKEREEGLDPGELAASREHAAEIAIAAGERMADPAAVFAAVPHGLRLVRDSKRVSSSALSRVRDLHADATKQWIDELTAMPGGTDLLAEWRFWALVEERMEDAEKGTACGDRDMGIQARVDGVNPDGSPRWGFRLSWLTRQAYPRVPTLLLDASSDIDITALIFEALNPAMPLDAELIAANPNARRLVHHPLDVPLDLRVVAIADKTYSTSSFIPRFSADPVKAAKQKMDAAAQTNDTLLLTSMICGQYGWGNVLFGATKKVREHLLKRGDQPDNLDSGHYGAMRGRDVFKNHVAAHLVGRTEQPVDVVDAMVGALTRRSRTPEGPLDVLGTGLDIDGKPVMRSRVAREVMMRSGYDVGIEVSEMPGFYARKLDQQWRDEETKQALGRLRTVYASSTRWEPPVAFLQTSVIPRGVIVDEMISMDDVKTAHDAVIMDALRHSHGVLCPVITPRLYPRVTPERVQHFIDHPTRSHWGFTPAAWVDDNGEGEVGHKVLVATHYADPEAAIRRALDASGLYAEIALERVDVGVPNKPRVEGLTVSPDKVSALFMTFEDRERMVIEREAWLQELGDAAAGQEDVYRRLFETEYA